jgi:orotate phosphoribosyltransferase
MLFRYKILYDAYEDEIEQANDLMIGGLETGAILLSMSILSRMAITGFYVRKQPKDHGNQKLVVTPKDLNGKNIVIIDDIMTSGSSIFQAIGSIRLVYPDAKIWKIYTLIDRSHELDFDPFEKYWTDKLTEDDTGFHSVFDSEEDFINLLQTKTAEEKGRRV